jgi:ribosomal protein S18 acetylase RimI-like enzyme
MDIIIERAVIGDAEAILALQRLCFQREAELYNDYTLPPLTQTLPSLLEEFTTHCILVARCNGEVIGSARAIQQRDSCYIARVIVHPRMQRRGIATRLMDAIECEFPDAVRFELFTGSRSEGNLRLYEGLGYKRIGIHAASPKVELVLLEKRASAPDRE